MFVLGLTGSVGMGKSQVSAFFRELGVPVQDADKVVHDLYAEGGAAVGPVGEAFPGCVVNGAVDRGLLGQQVLARTGGDALKVLEGIVHPLVARERQQFVKRCRDEGHALAVCDIPLLFETGLQGHFDGIAVVSAPKEVQRERVLARPGMTVDKFESILAKQVPDEEKRAKADVIIDTGCSLDATREQVRQLVAKLSAEGNR